MISRRTAVASPFAPRNWRLVLYSMLALMVASGCSYDSANLDQISCDTDSQCPGDATCEAGYCVTGQTELDAGDDAEADGGTDVDVEPDVLCDPESDDEFCARHGAECGLLTEDDNCGDQRIDVDCGSCDGEEECGEDIPNVCGCPCDIEGQCYAIGDSAENECQICSPQDSESEFSDAPDGTECDDGDPCTDSTCQGGACASAAICDGSPTSCGCDSCQDCTELDGWYPSDDDPYDCCDGPEICTCQPEELRQYHCDEMDCTYETTDSRIDVSGCGPCGGDAECSEEGIGAVCIEPPECEGDEPVLGAGTDGDPYLLCSAQHLEFIDDHRDASFRIVEDIDLSTSSFDGLPNFSGTLDGGGHTIDGLNLDQSGNNDVGFISDNAGTISDLHFSNVFVRGDETVGVVAATNSGTIADVTVAGNGSGSPDIIGEGENIGGLVGVNNGDIHRSGTDVLIESENDNLVGGFAGHNNGDIYESRSLGDVLGGDTSIGGFVGRNDGTIEDSYAVGDVEAESSVGGFAGRSHQGTIVRSYAFGQANGDENVGGFVGEISGGAGNSTFTFCYWNGTANGADTSGDTIELPEDDFAQQGSFDGSWDFGTIWFEGPDDRPILHWEQ